VADPLLVSSYSFTNRLQRLVWGVVYTFFFRPSPQLCRGWRRFVLRCFGAKIGAGAHISPKAVIWAPWNLECEDTVLIGEGAIIYNPSLIKLCSHVVVSQEAYLCGATHDHNDRSFPLMTEPIIVQPWAWICARATVQMGLTVGTGAVLALGAVAVKDLEPWTVYGGVPAKPIGRRTNFLE